MCIVVGVRAEKGLWGLCMSALTRMYNLGHDLSRVSSCLVNQRHSGVCACVCVCVCGGGSTAEICALMVVVVVVVGC
jgi:hypothetical protein